MQPRPCCKILARILLPVGLAWSSPCPARRQTCCLLTPQAMTLPDHDRAETGHTRCTWPASRPQKSVEEKGLKDLRLLRLLAPAHLSETSLARPSPFMDRAESAWSRWGFPQACAVTFVQAAQHGFVDITPMLSMTDTGPGRVCLVPLGPSSGVRGHPSRLHSMAGIYFYFYFFWAFFLA